MVNRDFPAASSGKQWRPELAAACMILPLLVGCASTIHLYDGPQREEAAVARLRVDGAMMLTGAIKVRRIDKQWGPYGGAAGFHFNDKNTWGVNVNLPPGPHAIEVTFEGVPSTLLRAQLEANHEYNIVVVKERPTCVRLLDKAGPVVTEACYAPSNTLSQCSEARSRLLFSVDQAKKELAEKADVILQSVDGIYGPNNLVGFYFFNTPTTWAPYGDLNIEVCPGAREMVVGLEIPTWDGRWGMLAPITLNHDLKAGQQYRFKPVLGKAQNGIRKMDVLLESVP